MAEQIIQASIANALSTRYLRYAMYSIKDRALGDTRDGLKPVALRSIYSMYEMGLLPSRNAKTKKSARVVGNVIGK